MLREDLIGLPYVVDGVVKLAHTNENDKELLTMLHQWYSEGLIASEVISYGSHNALYDYMIENGKVGYANIFPEDVLTYEYNTAEDPDCRWDAIRKPLRTDDQVLHLGGKKNRVLYAAAAVNIRCENIPLAVSWLDYRYSPSGSQYLSYGPEGYLWEQDESGNYIAAAGSLESGYAGFKDLSRFYGINIYEEAGMELLNRRYIIPGGDRLLSMYAVWDDYSYDGAYEWPSKIVLTQAQTEEMNQTASYIKNYVQNNYFGFIDGSRDLSEWDAYIAHLNELGIGRILEIYQDAYNSHMT